MVDPSFFGLSGHPFTKPASSDSHCLADEHLALTTELQAGLKAPHGITLLIGEEGAGKSTFIRNFIAQLPDSFVVAYLPTAGPGLRHLLTEAVEQLGGTVVPGGGEQALIDVLRSLARARSEHDRATLVVIDDAHELPAKTIERLGKLFGNDPAEPSRLHVTLVGRPELLDRMNAANDRSILKHLVQVCRMDAIGPEDAFRYIADRVQKVGGIVDRLFTEDALRLIVQRANGNPARIDQICSAALERAADRGAHAVDTDAVDVACTGNTSAGNNQISMTSPSDPPEPPTYFFSEEEEEAESTLAAKESAVRDAKSAMTAATTSDTVVTVAASSAAASNAASSARPAAVGTSRRRLAFWAAGAIAVVAAFAGVMTLPKKTAIEPSGDMVAKAPAVAPVAKRERTAREQAPAEGAEPKAQGEVQPAPVAVPKLVVRRNGEGANGARANRKQNEQARTGQGQDAAAPGAVASGADAAGATKPDGDAGGDRPRFQAPPLSGAAGTPAASPSPSSAGAPPGSAAGAAATPPAGAAPSSAPPSPPASAAVAQAPTAAAPASVPPVMSAPTAPAAPAAAATGTAPTQSPPAAVASAPKPAAAPSAAVPPAAPAKPRDAGLVAPTRSTPSNAPAAATRSSPPTPVAKTTPPAAAASAGPYTIQVGAFSSRANAEALVAKIRANAPDGKIVASTADGKPVFRVVVGSFASPAQAGARAKELAKAGMTTFVRRVN